jgi:hypothetical protein
MEIVIADAGPLVAYLKRDDKDHDWLQIYRKHRRQQIPLLYPD